MDVVPDLTSSKVKLSGHCANNESKVLLRASWKNEGRKKQLNMRFTTAYVRNLVSQLEELRWQMQTVSYTESYSGQSVTFSSNNAVMSAPLKQKFICRDKLNITLSSEHYKDYVLELHPEITAQPYHIASSHPSCMLYHHEFVLRMHSQLLFIPAHKYKFQSTK
ncbi:unnamed protein product [Gongylonema pulchrum]|uniref:Arrestin_N domain-containing protein n=1 Tax=Gongylonema pulchrum TaxID=637853 RepID=A0A183CYQ7_9BILA|nr:unnamed protein product [Gongylonema pulchrum]